MKPASIFTIIGIVTFNIASLFAQDANWRQQNSPVVASLRGLHVINDTLAWASGAKGAILRTLDGGENWQQLPAPDTLDFRSLWAFDTHTAMVASAGQPARVYYTQNAGHLWELLYDDTTGLAFFDAIRFVNMQQGWILSDPIKGKILLLQTKNGGRHWESVEMPLPKDGEAFFAASNGSLATYGTKHAWIGTGGTAIRVLATIDAGVSWQVQPVPLQQRSPASGIYALTFADFKNGVAIGGAYDLPQEPAFTACYTTNGGKRWKLPLNPPRGYRSGIAHLPGTRTFVAVGTTGTDLSSNGGKTWIPVNDENLNSIRFSPSGKRGWAVGSGGKIFVINNY